MWLHVAFVSKAEDEQRRRGAEGNARGGTDGQGKGPGGQAVG